MKDLLTLAGLITLGTGLWWIHPPSCLIVLGLFLLAGGLTAHFWRPKR